MHTYFDNVQEGEKEEEAMCWLLLLLAVVGVR
jgi:hypothetical protein